VLHVSGNSHVPSLSQARVIPIERIKTRIMVKNVLITLILRKQAFKYCDKWNKRNNYIDVITTYIYGNDNTSERQDS